MDFSYSDARLDSYPAPGSNTMNATRTTPSTSVNPPLPAALQNNANASPLRPGMPAVPRQVGYGLPCAKCRTYYAADMKACPVCQAPERVSPFPASAPAILGEELPEMSADEAALEAERERFLREFKSQVYASHLQINAAASFRCTEEQNHVGAFEPAAVCQGCFDRVRERVDHMEAALHIDIREAAQIVYDAVWGDASDPNKTYQNAAQALLYELRRRAGISSVLGPHQPLAH